MSNVAVEKHTLDVLATAISNKSGVPVTMTLTEMIDAVDSIQTGGGEPSLQTKTVTYTPTTSQQTASITADSGYDGLEEVDVTVNAIPSNYVDTSDANATQYSLLDGATAYVNGAKITGVIPQMTQYTGDMSQYFHTESNQRKWSFEGIIRTSQGGMVNPGASFGTGEYTYNAVPANTVITPTSQAQTVGGANWMMEGAITINASSSGGSSWQKIVETTYGANTTSTTATTVATWATGSTALWTSDKWLYVRVRDTQGKRQGYFYGSDTFFFNPYPTNQSTNTQSTSCMHTTIRYTSNGTFEATNTNTTTGYGLYADTLYNDGRIRIRVRYNSSYSLTVNGTYKVEVYLLTPPTGAPIVG